MRTAMLVILAACGGGSSDGETGGTVDADLTVDGAPRTFSEPCQLTESDTFLDITATGDGVGLEIKWKKAIIVAPGTYPTGGIVADLFLFALKGEQIIDGTGSVTFTTYVAPSEMVGTFTLNASGFSATGSFDCR